MSNTLKTQVMKRLLTIGLMLASAFALTNCTEQIASPVEEENIILGETMEIPEDAVRTPYEIYVDGNETKTISDGESVYWVSEASAVANNLDRSAADKINLFSIPATNGTSYTTHGEFVYVGNQTFSGNLNGTLEDMASSNNWLSLYPSSSVCSSSAATGNTPASISAKVSIGESTLSGIVRDNKSHIAGTQYPMYGIKNNVPKNKTPKFKMSHLYALVALEIVNVGDGKTDDNDQPITISNIAFTAPDNITGDFNVNVTDNKHVFSDVANNSKTITLTGLKDTEGETGITIDPRESATLYFAIKPYDASNKELTISINGTEKEVKMPDNTKFTEGKITTLKVPVKLSQTKETTTALNFLSFNFEDADETSTRNDITINGELINAYVLHETVKEEKVLFWTTEKHYPHSINITGVASDLFNALGAGFYVSTWKDKPSSMTVDNINLWMLDNGKYVHIADYQPFINAMKGELGDLIGSIVPLLVGDGISRDDGLITLTRFIDPSSITFNGIVSNGASKDNPNIFMLDDETIHKTVGKANIEKLLTEKFSFKTNDGGVLIPSYQGMMDIMNGVSSLEAIRTADAIYGKIMDKVAGNVVSALGMTVNVENVFRAIFKDADDMRKKLPSAKVSVKIKNHPSGTNEYPNPLIFWGFDVYNPFDE